MAMNTETKSVVLSRLSSGEYFLSEKTNFKNSPLWGNFKTVCIARTGQYANYVQCTKCKALYCHKDRSGTGNLSRHVEKCNTTLNPVPVDSSGTQTTSSGQSLLSPPSVSTHLPHTPSPSVPSPVNSPLPSPILSTPTTGTSSTGIPASPSTSFSSLGESDCTSRDANANNKTMKSRKGGVKKDITKEKKQEVTDLCVQFAAIDLRPFNVVKGDGFKNLAQGLINIGAEHGKVDVNQVLPHPSTISKKTGAVAQRVREEFLPEVQEAVKEGACAFDMDMWTDRYNKRAYLTFECQYTNCDFELKSQTLYTKQFPAKVKKTGRNIKTFMEAELRKMNIALEDARRNYFTTDQGSNMITCLQDYLRLNCSSHLTATVLRNIFDFQKKKTKSFLFKECPACYDVIMACKSMVTYIKRSGKNLDLARTVKMMADTRWNTLLDMLESVCAALLDIITLLQAEGHMDKINGWDAELATQLVSFLTPFKNICVELQARKTPTLQLVLIRYHDLLDNCVVKADEDHEEIITIKTKAKQLLQDKFSLEDIHYAAAVLNPDSRNLKALDDASKNRARRVILEMLRKLPKEQDASTSTQQLDPNDTSPAEKKRRLGRWSEYGDDDTLLGDAVELDFYLKVGKPDSDDPAKLLPWWKSKSSMFARLSRLARRVLAVPATSASSERTFSRAGLLVTDKRTRIGAEKVNDLLVIHNYFLNTRNYVHEKKMFMDQTEDCGNGSGPQDCEEEDWEEEGSEGEICEYPDGEMSEDSEDEASEDGK